MVQKIRDTLPKEIVQENINKYKNYLRAGFFFSPL